MYCLDESRRFIARCNERTRCDLGKRKFRELLKRTVFRFVKLQIANTRHFEYYQIMVISTFRILPDLKFPIYVVRTNHNSLLLVAFRMIKRSNFKYTIFRYYQISNFEYTQRDESTGRWLVAFRITTRPIRATSGDHKVPN